MGIERKQRNGLSEPDLSSADAADWPQREFPSVKGRRGDSVPVVIKQSIVNAVRRHGQQHPNVEVCGVLVGHGYRDDEGHFVYLEGFIQGDHAGSQVAQVTFTGDTWNHIYEVLDKAWPDSRILGWYHTHPGFGIFLSGMDLFIHESFFGAPDQVALVYDPLNGDEGLFVWEKGRPVRRRFLVEDDAEEVPTLQIVTAAARGTAEGSGDLLRRLDGIRRRLNALLILVALLWIVTIVGLVGAFQFLTPLDSGTGDSAPAHIQKPLPGTPHSPFRTLDEEEPGSFRRHGTTPIEAISQPSMEQAFNLENSPPRADAEQDRTNRDGNEPSGNNRGGDEAGGQDESPASGAHPENTPPPAKGKGDPM